MKSAKSYASRVEEALGASVLQKQPLGREGLEALWVESKSLPALAETLEAGTLEALTGFQLEGAIVLTYLVRSSTATEGLVALRSSVIRKDAEPLEVPSVGRTWPAAGPFERELSAALGIRFTGGPA